jgi:hypothetical protein
MRKLILFLFLLTNFFSKNIFCDDFYFSHQRPFAPSDSEGIVSRGDELRNFLDDCHKDCHGVKKNFSQKLKSTDGREQTPVGFILSDHNLSAANYIHLAYLSYNEIFSRLCECSSYEIERVKNSMGELLAKISDDKDFKVQISYKKHRRIGNFEREKIKRNRDGLFNKLWNSGKDLAKPKYKPALQVFAEYLYEKSNEAFEKVYENECREKTEVIRENSDVIIENSLNLKNNFADNEVVVKMSDLSLTCAGCAIECAKLRNFDAGFNFLGLAKCSSYVAKELAKISLSVSSKLIEGLELGCRDIGLVFKEPRKYFGFLFDKMLLKDGEQEPLKVDSFLQAPPKAIYAYGAAARGKFCKEISNFIALVKEDKLKASGEIAKFLTRTFLNVGFWAAAYFYVLTPLATGLSATGNAIANLATEIFSAKVASVVGSVAAAQPTIVASGLAEKAATVVGVVAQSTPLITRVAQQIIESVAAFAAGDGGGVSGEGSFKYAANEKRRKHILEGDERGGGHMWPGKHGKSIFPESWSGDKIMDYAKEIANDLSLNKTWTRGKHGSLFTKSGLPARYYVEGLREGVKIRVVIEPAGEGIITAFPVD